MYFLHIFVTITWLDIFIFKNLFWNIYIFFTFLFIYLTNITTLWPFINTFFTTTLVVKFYYFTIGRLNR